MKSISFRFCIALVSSSTCLAGVLGPMQGCSSDNSGTNQNPTVGSVATILVPAGGGSIDVATTSGTKLTFDFPASTAGKAFVLTATDPTTIGWTADDLQDVVKMEPDGTQFADPVTVHASTDGVLFATFPSKSAKTAPEWLSLSADGKGAELHHFSTLAIVKSSCAFSAQASSPICTQSVPGGGTLLSLACDMPQFCNRVSVACCVDPKSGAKDCQLGAASLTFTTASLASNTAPPAFCSAGATAGPDASAEPDASANDASSGNDSGAGDDAGVGDGGIAPDNGVNGNCGTPVFTTATNLGPNTCIVHRTDGQAKIMMECLATSCRCYTNSTSAPYGTTFSSGTSDCGSSQLAIQQMLTYCGCPAPVLP